MEQKKEGTGTDDGHDAASDIRDFLWDLCPVEMATRDAARFIPEFKVTKYELGVLARHYFDIREDHYFFNRLYQQWGSSESRECAFSGARLAKIGDAIGKEALDAALATLEEKWRDKYAEADSHEHTLAPCSLCGGKRTIADDANDPEGRCLDCANRAYRQRS